MKIGIVFFIGMLVFGTNMHAQDNDNLRLKGKIKSELNNKQFAYILLKSGQIVFDTIEVSKSGKFNFELPLNHVFDVVFKQEGCSSKKIEINTCLPAKMNSFQINNVLFDYRFKISLLKNNSKFDYFYEHNPVGKIQYDPYFEGFDYDVEYAQIVAEELNRIENFVNQMNQYYISNKNNKSEDDNDGRLID